MLSITVIVIITFFSYLLLTLLLIFNKDPFYNFQLLITCWLFQNLKTKKYIFFSLNREFFIKVKYNFQWSQISFSFKIAPYIIRNINWLKPWWLNIFLENWHYEDSFFKKFAFFENWLKSQTDILSQYIYSQFKIRTNWVITK